MRKGMEMFKQFSGRLGATVLAGVAISIVLAMFVTPAVAQTTFNRSIAWVSTGHLVFSDTAPTIASGFGTSPSIAASNGATVIRVNVGGGGSATDGVITMPAATAGWVCAVQDFTGALDNDANAETRQIATTTTSVTVEHQTISTGAAVAWTASDILQLLCGAY